jgi:glycosyltransferase involved in cell wall biosynthesis
MVGQRVMKPVRLLAIIEAETITGPAKNLLQFAASARSGWLDPAIEVTIATFFRGGSANLFVDNARGAGLVVHVLAERGRFDRSVIAALKALARQVSPDLIQTHAVKSHFFARLAGLHHLAPWIAFHHGYTWPDRRARLYNQLDYWSLRAAAQVVTVSLPFKDELVRKGVAPGRIEVVHNAIDLAWGAKQQSPEVSAALRAKLGIPSSKKIVLVVGRLSREKDHITLLESMLRLRPEVAAHLLIVGDGPERSRIEAGVLSLELAADVTFTGQVPSAEPFYALADLAVLSSRSEGSPNALLEAMAARVPIVATSVGGVPEIVSNGESALLVEPGNAESMADAIGALLTDAGLAARLTSQAHERAASLHSPEARTRRLWQLYLGLR